VDCLYIVFNHTLADINQYKEYAIGYHMGDSMYYSQCGEDEYLNTNYFKNLRGGTFLEMGALDGITYSNTKFFEDTLGWTGVLIEPHPVQFQNLTQTRPNCHLFNTLVSDMTAELKFKYFLYGLSPVSGVESTLPESHFKVWFQSDNPLYKNLPQSEVMIKPRTLTSIVKESGVPYIDFFSLDVEGHELNVLKSFDFSIPVYLLLIECLDKYSPNEIEISDILKKNGFILVDNVAHNNIWLNERESLRRGSSHF